MGLRRGEKGAGKYARANYDEEEELASLRPQPMARVGPKAKRKSCVSDCWYVVQWFLAGCIVSAFGGIFLFRYLHPAAASQSTASFAAAAALNFRAEHGKLYCNGELLFIKGINWFGSEAYNGPPNGLDKHDINWYLDFLQEHEFNAIRILFNHEDVLQNDIIDAPTEERLLAQTRYRDMFVVVAREAARRGILLMLACHRLRPDAWPGTGLWYDESIGFTEARVLQSWSLLAEALCGQWNVFAVDLQNEPHASSWGKELPTDWNVAAERIGNHVLSACPRWLVMVEGVGYDPGAPGGDDPAAGYWWGENLVGARVAPVVLDDQTKLVYSPHVYGPSVYMQHYFESADFPSNMPGVWDQHFAFAQELTGQPIIIGELGGKYIDKDKTWQDWAINYMKEKGFGLFYFALQPDSEDTGGLLQKDWSLPEPGSAETGKLEALAILPSTRILESCAECRIAASEVPASDEGTLQSGASPSGEGSGISKTDKHALSLLFTVPLLFVLVGLLYRFCQDPAEQEPDVLPEATLSSMPASKPTAQPQKPSQKSIEATRARCGGAASPAKETKAARTATTRAASFAGKGAAKGGVRAAAFSRKAKAAEDKGSDSSRGGSSKKSSSDSGSDSKSDSASETSVGKSADEDSSERSGASGSSSSPERPSPTKQKGEKRRAATSRVGRGRSARKQRGTGRDQQSDSTTSANSAESGSGSSEAENESQGSSAGSKSSLDVDTADKEKPGKRPMQKRPSSKKNSGETAQQPVEPVKCESPSAADPGSQARHFLQLATQYAAAHATSFSCAYAAVVAAEPTQGDPATNAPNETAVSTVIDIPTPQEPTQTAPLSQASFMGLSVNTARL